METPPFTHDTDPRQGQQWGRMAGATKWGEEEECGGETGRGPRGGNGDGGPLGEGCVVVWAGVTCRGNFPLKEFLSGFLSRSYGSGPPQGVSFKVPL